MKKIFVETEIEGFSFLWSICKFCFLCRRLAFGDPVKFCFRSEF